MAAQAPSIPQDGEAAEKPAGKGKKKLLLILLPVLLLAGGGGAAFFLGLIPGMGRHAAPAAEGEFCCRERMTDGKPTLGKCHRKACKFFPRKDVKCYPTADAAKAAGCAGFCKICCKDLQ